MKACKFFGAKVAFEIPKSCEVKSRQGWKEKEIPDKLIDRLFEVFPSGGVEFISEDICSPHLLVVDVREPLTPELIASMVARINGVLNPTAPVPPQVAV